MDLPGKWANIFAVRYLWAIQANFLDSNGDKPGSQIQHDTSRPVFTYRLESVAA